jgi:hypothetical protein
LLLVEDYDEELFPDEDELELVPDEVLEEEPEEDDPEELELSTSKLKSLSYLTSLG